MPYKTTFDEAQVVATPVLYKDLLLCLTAWNRGSFMLKLDPGKPAASVLWRTRARPTTMISTPLFQDDRHFYAVELDGSLCCVDATTGKDVWATPEPIGPGGGTAHLTPNGDRVFLFNQTGHLILARLSPQGYQELGRCLLVEPTAGYRPQGRLTWAHPAYANRCVFARNDRELVCASLGGDQPGGIPASKQTVTARLLTNFQGRKAAAALAFSPDCRTLALGAGFNTVKLLDLATGKELPAPSAHRDWVCSVAFSPDGKTLATGSADWTIRLWDLAREKEQAVLKGHRGAVYCLAFSADGKTLATGSGDETVKLWDLTTRKERAALRGHRSGISAVAFAPDGRTLASAGIDDAVRLWELTRDQ